MSTTPIREPRSSVILYARVVATQGVAEVRVRNLSATGACLDNPGLLQAGDRVSVTMGVLTDLEADIMWVTPALAGLHFAGGAIDLAAARTPRARDMTAAGGPTARAGWMDNIQHAYRRH